MNLLSKIKAEQLKARKTGDVTRAKLLTTVIGEADPYGRGEVSDDDVTKVLIKFGKNIDDSISAYRDRGVNTTVLESERYQLNEFLPKYMTTTDMLGWIEFNLHPDSTVRDAMVGIQKYATEEGYLVDKREFAKLVNNR